MSLNEELQGIRGKKRRFLLLRVAEVDTPAARGLLGVSVGTYNQWVNSAINSHFVQVYRRRDELATLYKQEAIQLLRRDNQRSAVILEEKIIKRMTEEIDSGKYSLIRTLLARDVFNKLMNDLDYQPQTVQTWEQRWQQLNVYGNPQQEVRDGQGQVIEATPSLIEQHQEGRVVTQGEQDGSPIQEELQD